MKSFTKILLTFLLICLVMNNFSHAADYQYQYFNDKAKKKKYVPFSDYIPRIRLHYQTVPHYVEDFYELYGMKMYYNENSLRTNIRRLKVALTCNFRHPSEALVQVDSEDEYLKYRKLMFMHINLLIMRNYMKIASKYDMKSIKFYHSSFAKEINESLDIAQRLYQEAAPYWEEAKKHATNASQIKITTRLGYIESERYSIIHNELDYGKIIQKHISKVKEKQNQVQAIQTNQTKRLK